MKRCYLQMHINEVVLILLISLMYSCDKSEETSVEKKFVIPREHIDNQNTGYLPDVSSPNEIVEASILFESDFVQKNTPVIWDGKMFIGDEFVFNAIDLNTGAIIWSYPTEDAVYSSAVLQDEVLYFGDDSWYFYALDANTGESKWVIRANGNIRGNPIVSGNLVYFSDTYCCFYAVNKVSGELVWSREAAYEGAPAIIDNKLIFGSEIGEVYAVDPLTGQDIWVFKDPNDSYISAGISGKMSTVIVPAGVGTIYALNANDGSIKWKYETDYRVSFDATAAISEEYVVLGSNSASPQAISSRIYCLNINSGELVWSTAFQDDNNRFAFTGSPIIANDVVVIGDISLGLHGLELATGDSIWNYYDDQWRNIQGTPAIYDGFIIAPFGTGRIHKLKYTE